MGVSGDVRFRVSSEGEDWPAILSLLRDAFAYMEERIDPPSSLTRWTEATIAAEAAEGFVVVGEAGDRTVACLFGKPRADALYLGKIAVAKVLRGEGLMREMMAIAAAEARLAGLAALELQSRIELVENHAAFRALGFDKIAETAHPGYDRPTSVTMRRPLGEMT